MKSIIRVIILLISCLTLSPFLGCSANKNQEPTTPKDQSTEESTSDYLILKAIKDLETILGQAVYLTKTFATPNSNKNVNLFFKSFNTLHQNLNVLNNKYPKEIIEELTNEKNHKNIFEKLNQIAIDQISYKYQVSLNNKIKLEEKSNDLSSLSNDEIKKLHLEWNDLHTQVNLLKDAYSQGFVDRVDSDLRMQLFNFEKMKEIETIISQIKEKEYQELFAERNKKFEELREEEKRIEEQEEQEKIKKLQKLLETKRDEQLVFIKETRKKCGPPTVPKGRIVKEFKKLANDPSSVRLADCSKAFPTEQYCWVTSCGIRAKNGYGALMLKHYEISFSNKHVEFLD